jgi:type I restriction enzyme, S subunit
MKHRPLSEIAQVIMGQSPPSSSYNTQGNGLPFFQGKADFGELYPTRRVFCTDPLKTTEANDILISVRAPVGPTNLNQKRACIGRGLAALRCYEKHDTNYLLYFLRFYEPQLANVATGSTFDAISRDDLENISLPYPSLLVRTRIAAILAKADRLRRLRQYALELSGTYLQAVFLEMFGDPVTNPKGWNIVPLGDMLSISPHLGTITPAKESGKQLCARVGEIGEWQINLNQCKYVSLEGNELKRFSLQTGDIVLARAIGSEAHLGKLSIMGNSSIPVVFDSHLMRIRTNSSRLLTLFLACWLKTDGGRARFMQQARATSVQFNINTEQIASIEIPTPPIPLQQKFVQIIEKHLRIQAQQREAARQAEHLFQTLLHKAFHGELTGDESDIVEEAVAMMPQKVVARPEPLDRGAYQLALPLE